MTIKELREKNNLSQAKLAKALGVSPSTVASIESGRQNVSQKIADAVKNVYDVVIEVDPKAEEKVKAAKVTAEEAKEKATIAAIEAKAIADEIAIETAEKVEEAEKKAQETKTKVKAVKKKAETKAVEAADKVKKVEKKAQQTKAKAQATKKNVETNTAKKVETKAPVKKAAAKKQAEPAKVIIQSPLGGEITPENILKKVGEVDTVYVRVDQNKAYWVKGTEYGSVDLW